MDFVQLKQPREEQKQQGEVPPPIAAENNNNNNKRKANRPKKRSLMPLTEDQRIDRIEQFKEKAMKEIKRRRDMEIDFKTMPDEDIYELAQTLEEWEIKALKAEQLANTIIDYEDAEYNVDALLEGQINEFVPVERIIIFDRGFEPLNQKLTAFVNAPIDQIDHDIYRRLNPIDVDRMVLDVRAEGNCPLIDEIFCGNKNDTDKYGKYMKFMVGIIARVNKRIDCKLMERVIEVNSELSANKVEEEKSSETNGENDVGSSTSSATAPPIEEPSDDLNLFRFEQINPDEIHRSVMQQIRTGIELGLLENAAPQLEPLDDPNEVSPGEDDVCDLEQNRDDDDIQELDEEEEEGDDSDESDNDDDDGKENGVVQNLPGAGITGGAPPHDQKAVDGVIVVGGDDDVIELSSGGASDVEEDCANAFWNETGEEENTEYWHDKSDDEDDDGAGYDPDEIMVVDEAFNDKNNSFAGSNVITLD